MRRLVPPLALSLLACFACGGPLDRVDGRLVVTIEGLPAEANRIDLRLKIGDREFATQVPATETIDVFSAVPVGDGTLDITLLQGARVLARRIGMPVLIEAEATATIAVDFDDGPAIDIDVPAVQRVYESTRVDVEVLDRSFAESLRLEASVLGEPLAVPPRSATGWLFDFDAFAAGDLLPVDLVLTLEACTGERPPSCSHHERTVRVQRDVWSGALTALSSVSPVFVGDRVVTADDDGRVTIFAGASGEPVDALDRPGPLLAAMGVKRDRVFVVDAQQEIVAIDVETGTVSAWTARLPGSRATDLVPYGAGFVVGSGRDLVFVGDDGATRTIFTAAQTIRARPFVEGASIVVVDVDGRVTRVDGDGAVLEAQDLATDVRSGPARLAGVTWVGTLDGRLVSTAGDTFPIGEPIAHPLVVVGEQVVAAAGASVVFAEGASFRRVRLVSPITGAPVAFDGGVLVGLRSGLLILVRPDGRQRTLSRLAGAALAASVAPNGDVIAVGSTGEIVRLRAEEEFLP